MTTSIQVVAFAGVTSLLAFVAGLRMQGNVQNPAASEQYDASKRVWRLMQSRREAGEYDTRTEDETYCIWSRRLADAAVQGQALSLDEAFGQHLARMRELVEQTEKLAAVGQKSALDLAVVQYYAAEARGLIERSKGR